MGLLIFFGGLAIYAIGTFLQTHPKNKHAFTSDELQQMSKAMCGKSKAECKRILCHYTQI